MACWWLKSATTVTSSKPPTPPCPLPGSKPKAATSSCSCCGAKTCQTNPDPRSALPAEAIRLAGAGDEPRLQHGRQLICCLRPAHQIALAELAAMLAQKVVLRPGFDAFCNDLQFKPFCQRQNRRDDLGVALLPGELADKRLVDLEPVERQLLEVTQAGVAGAEVVERQPHPHGTQAVEAAAHLVVHDQHHVLGNFKLETLRCQTGAAKHL